MEVTPAPTLKFADWGCIEYEKANQCQLDWVNEIANQQRPDTIVFCSHPPVVTLGRSSKEDDITSWVGPVVQTSRGGRATYHGPNQLVVYPLLDLSKSRTSLPARDVHAYLRWLESVILKVLDLWDITAEVRTHTQESDSGEKLSLTGVWVGEQKIASIGVAVKRWVTYHGLALNVDKDEKAFQGIQPCGFTPKTMVTMEELLAKPISRKELISSVCGVFKDLATF